MLFTRSDNDNVIQKEQNRFCKCFIERCSGKTIQISSVVSSTATLNLSLDLQIYIVIMKSLGADKKLSSILLFVCVNFVTFIWICSVKYFSGYSFGSLNGKRKVFYLKSSTSSILSAALTSEAALLVVSLLLLGVPNL